MAYKKIPYQPLYDLITKIYENSGFTAKQSADITENLLRADLYGIESHGISRLIRYDLAMQEGSIDPKAGYTVVHETPMSAVWDAPKSMGQVVATEAMTRAIEMAKQHGMGAVVVRGSNHYGIAGYYTKMAADADLLGMCMTNTEAIAIPTGGKKAMLGTSPIAIAMPADPVPFWYDAATTVVTRGKLEVYNKNSKPLPTGWAADENGADCADAQHVLDNIIGKLGGGIFPLGGFAELTGSHKGYGLGVIVELFTAIFAGGTTSPHVKNSGNADTSFCFWAFDYGLFGDKAQIRARMSTLLQELRDSPKADGVERIYTHGEKEFESAKEKLETGIPVNERTFSEILAIARRRGIDPVPYIGAEF